MILPLSYRNCHVRGLHSVVLQNTHNAILFVAEWDELQPADQQRAVEQASRVGRLAATVNFAVTCEATDPDAREYRNFVVEPLYVAGTFASDIATKWLHRCWGYGNPKAQKDERIEAFLAGWRAVQVVPAAGQSVSIFIDTPSGPESFALNVRPSLETVEDLKVFRDSRCRSEAADLVHMFFGGRQ